MNIRFLTLGLAAGLTAAAWAEAPYAFRQAMETVHRADVRDAAFKPTAQDFVFSDGATIAIGAQASDFVRRVAHDFVDYLDVSMRVSARVVRSDAGAVVIKVDSSLPARRYTVTVTAQGVTLVGADERALAQAFYHLEDRMNFRKGPFLAFGNEVRTPRFETRLTHTGYGYATFPEAHLNAMVHAGMTALCIYYQGPNATGENNHREDHNAIIRRAKKYGLDVYFYSEIPTFFHPDDGLEPFERGYGEMARLYPDVKGIIIVGESCQFPSKDPRVQPVTWRNKDKSDPRPTAGWFPCSDYPAWVRAVDGAIKKHAPQMRVVFWTYNWGWAPEKDRAALIDALPEDTILEATFEMFEQQTKRNGLTCPTADYSLSFAGPGNYFVTEAKAAKRRGLTLFTQAQGGGRTWDFGTAPYEPFPMQWNRRWTELVKAHDQWGLSGIMENHHYGWSPTFIAELEKEAYTEGGIPFDQHLRMIAVRDFGEANADAAVAAWGRWSRAILDYVPTDLNQYGPFRCGPAYPYTFGHKPVQPQEFPTEALSEVGSGFIRLEYLKHGFVPELTKEDSSVPYMEKELELLKSMIADLDAGADAFAAMPGKVAAKQARLGRYLACCCRTAYNTKRGAIADVNKDAAGILAAAKDEYANAQVALKLVEEDSHLGWEPMMDYVGGPRQIRFKLERMERDYGKDNLGIRD